ncbi:DUF6397 family protein, partial [Streptomyces sp. MCAF7]
RIPAGLRATLDEGEDQRAARWRRRRVEQLLALTDDPWERAAVWAALLIPAELDAVVTDPAERACLRELMPRLAPVPAGTGPAAEVTAALVAADDPVEIRRCRAALETCVRDAREVRPIQPPIQPPVQPSVPLPTGVAASPGGELAPSPARPRRRPLWYRLVRGRRSAADGPTAAYRGRKSPSCTTETSSRPARS